MESSRESDHSANSNRRMNRRKESEEVVDDGMVLDTTLAWKPFSKNLSPQPIATISPASPVISTLPPTEARSPFNEYRFQSGGQAKEDYPTTMTQVTELDRLLRACRDGQFEESAIDSGSISPALASPIRIYEDSEDAGTFYNAKESSNNIQSTFLENQFSLKPLRQASSNYFAEENNSDYHEEGNHSFEPVLENFQNYQATLTASDPYDHLELQSFASLPAQSQSMEMAFNGDLWSEENEIGEFEFGNEVILDSNGGYSDEDRAQEMEEDLEAKKEFQLAMKSHWRIAKP